MSDSDAKAVELEMANGTSEKGTLHNEGTPLLQFLAVISGFIAVMGYGVLLGWSSPSIPYLKTEIGITTNQGAWITSVPNIGMFLGLFTVTLLIDHLGRKYTSLLLATLQITSWIIIIFANSFIALCCGRFIGGIGVGGSLSVAPIYSGEIAQKRIRGTLSSIAVIFSDSGVFIAASAGAYLSYNAMNLVLLSIPLLHLITFIFMPETPYFYLMKGRDKEAVCSLMRLRGLKNAEVLQSEVEEMKKTVKENKHSGMKNGLRQLFNEKSNLRPFLIVICCKFASLSSGSIAMLAYAQEIFSNSGFSLTPANSFMIVVAVKIITGIAVTQLLVERVGRRILFLSSGISCSIALGTVGLFFFCKYQTSVDVSSFSFLPLICLICFHITAAVGIGPIPYVLMSEFFSIEVKQAAVPATFIVSILVSFSTEMMFPLVNDAFGIHFSFWIFATCCSTGSIVAFFIMPETKGRSLEEIQTFFVSKNK